MIERRESFQRRMRRWPIDKLVIVDESGVNLALTRKEAWAPRGERVVDDVPHGHWDGYSVVAALRTTGVVVPMLLRGAFDGPAMRAYSGNTWAPIPEHLGTDSGHLGTDSGALGH